LQLTTRLASWAGEGWGRGKAAVGWPEAVVEKKVELLREEVGALIRAWMLLLIKIWLATCTGYPLWHSVPLWQHPSDTPCAAVGCRALPLVVVQLIQAELEKESLEEGIRKEVAAEMQVGWRGRCAVLTWVYSLVDPEPPCLG
jgi:hypothetical protein